MDGATFAAATKATQIDSHNYEVYFHDSWCIGTGKSQKPKQNASQWLKKALSSSWRICTGSNSPRNTPNSRNPLGNILLPTSRPPPLHHDPLLPIATRHHCPPPRLPTPHLRRARLLPRPRHQARPTSLHHPYYSNPRTSLRPAGRSNRVHHERQHRARARAQSKHGLQAVAAAAEGRSGETCSG